ncbi:hypothetical protein ZEAMMB73_Zm00001d023211 [Zea mays]|uniref:Uncharacterized protein n=1 Tax=Zea mays TaxID=4577 RepID=A0A1D6IQ10_MAIZE|nr:hypothetical protein ZEAMMB73_Zm00001d023211 [Zea mays]
MASPAARLASPPIAPDTYDCVRTFECGMVMTCLVVMDGFRSPPHGHKYLVGSSASQALLGGDMAQINIEKAERVLGKVATAHRPPAEDSRPPETITDEERSMFRKLGLRIKAFLLLGIPLMKKLCHHNILLFIGAFMPPQRHCIVTEFLPWYVPTLCTSIHVRERLLLCDISSLFHIYMS